MSIETGNNSIKYLSTVKALLIRIKRRNQNFFHTGDISNSDRPRIYKDREGKLAIGSAGRNKAQTTLQQHTGHEGASPEQAEKHKTPRGGNLSTRQNKADRQKAEKGITPPRSRPTQVKGSNIPGQGKLKI